MSLRLAPFVLPLLLGLFGFPGTALAERYAPGSTSSSRPAQAAESGWLKSELYFGARIANGSLISPEAWAEFLEQVITPAFPDGLTVVQALGQMRSSNGVIRQQPTWVVVILRPRGSLEDQRIRSVINNFRSRFKGAELMRVDIPVTQPQFFAN
ncbi:DUF3574 domain-containing protein [Cyanobium sp. BA5m-21]|jgi:hypothetical protein|uniref:DUF3574 domain-containing protein n=1 Tax=unclassified Cyanobium TaxID=2627006 RepID=UPI0020CD3FE7|nr:MULTISPECIES: DUF3574 domain-containing protein [unclassified Cyanobium]MCP9904517.1 DUF3574 domain-containing protein [Cyanobium sp. BA5m-10]MCP9905573.1 DUF3574 domain-containing protein [Cyanobium sp. BA5m-21]